MKPKSTLFCLLIAMNFASKAQTYVTIPDTNFVNLLQFYYPSCMNGFQMDITCLDIQSATDVNVSYANISDLTGIEYFSSLEVLDCASNQLTNIPNLSGLTNLFIFYCGNNQLTSLPALPNNLSVLQCSFNQLVTLPPLPNSITNFNCGFNLLTSLPTLPNSLQQFVCSNNQLTNLPALPTNLGYFYCDNNQLTNLPSFPNSLQLLFCYNNLLTSLPTLSNSQKGLRCYNNHLTSIPTLPNSLNELLCGKNYLTTLPALTDSLTTLNCDSNNISCFQIFPVSIYDISIIGNPFTCLPNYITAMDSTTQTYPLCINGDSINNSNGCNGLNCFANYTTTYDSVQNIFTITIDPTTTNMATSYHWDFGDGTSSILATPSHIYTIDSLYNVCIKIFTTSGDSCTYCHIIGIDSLGNIIRSPGFTLNVQIATTIIDIFQNNSDNMQVSIYPNPFTSQMTVLFNKEMKNCSIKIVDMLGKKTNEINFTGKQLIIEKGSMKAGIYFLQVVDENKNLVNRKIIIE